MQWPCPIPPQALQEDPQQLANPSSQPLSAARGHFPFTGVKTEARGQSRVTVCEGTEWVSRFKQTLRARPWADRRGSGHILLWKHRPPPHTHIQGRAATQDPRGALPCLLLQPRGDPGSPGPLTAPLCGKPPLPGSPRAWLWLLPQGLPWNQHHQQTHHGDSLRRGHPGIRAKSTDPWAAEPP